ncbi:UbiX family flavin prenyltransferase [Paraphotobacterium marinum]|uniref:UbiX family flavin prenyltransferase n=1 Tax=Paraphotobacterium marinum TaxID=1755811 RepID=UPI001CEF8F21|nr:UbiX family flavin prenyltransferase [Paraphotobacterium marinum]
MKKDIIVGITGATGAPLAYKVLEILNDLNVNIHLMVSKWGARTIEIETDKTLKDFSELATRVYNSRDQAACISSGSFRTDGMIIVPCSMKTLSSISVGFADNLISRSADVILKEQKPLILVTRETPLSQIHLENMLKLSRMGVSIFPPMLTFYNHPKTIDDMTAHTAYRILDQLGIEHPDAKRWKNN